MRIEPPVLFGGPAMEVKEAPRPTIENSRRKSPRPEHDRDIRRAAGKSRNSLRAVHRIEGRYLAKFIEARVCPLKPALALKLIALGLERMGDVEWRTYTLALAEDMNIAEPCCNLAH